MSRSRPLLGLGATLLAGLIALAVVGSRAKSVQRETLGDFPVEKVATLGRGESVCQRPVHVPEGADRVTLLLAPGVIPRGPVDVDLRRLPDASATGGPVVASATRSRGVLSGLPVTLPLDRAPRAGLVSVCVTSRGREPVEVWGQSGPQAPSASAAYRDGEPLPADLFLEFPRPEPASVLSRLPEAFAHAAPFKLGFAGPWLFWLLAAAVVLGMPAGLAYGLRRAADEDASARS